MLEEIKISLLVDCLRVLTPEIVIYEVLIGF